MTGYASAQISPGTAPAGPDGGKATTPLRLGLEIRSVNSRFLDLTFRLGEELRAHEPALRELIAGRIKRGKVEVRAGVEGTAGDAVREPSMHTLQRLGAVQDSIRTWLPQAPHVFAGSIADNIRIGRPEATDAEIRRAAAQSGLDAVVAGLPDGYQTVVGDRGRTLSTGQRQRLALTRLFLRDPAVLLLDEPAAHLDEESAVALRAAIERFAVGRTLVVVSHRPEWFRLADREVALRDGRVEQAEHPVLERLAFAS